MMGLSEKRLFQNRNAHRSHNHGKNWRQVWVDCGGMCVHKKDGEPCCDTEYLEFHEPFGEDKIGWGIMQSRVLFCFSCHCEEHGDDNQGIGSASRPSGNNLNSDINREVEEHGGWDKWIKDFGLKDTFGRLFYE